MENMKNVKMKITASVLLICFSLTLVGSAKAEYTVGVKKGDWIQYRLNARTNVLGQWQTLASNWIKITINNVSSTVVSLTVESDQSGWTPTNSTVDVASNCQLNVINPIQSPVSGIGGVQSPLMALLATNLFIVPTNLNASGMIPTGYLSYEAVNDTTQYSGHDTAHYSMSAFSGLESVDAYWDRQKGMLLEYKCTFGSTVGQYTSSITVESTNMWSMPIGWLSWALIIVVVVIVIAIAVFIMRRRKHPAIPPAQ
jgi:hypothetical protein